MPYSARATTSGTAPALAFSKAFANEHPEFTEGRFEAYVIAPGRLLVTAPLPAEDEEDDPVLGAFLGFMSAQMQARPELIRPFSAADLEGVDDLLTGVEADPDEQIDDDFTLP
jgi:antitoxin PrlF